MGASPAPGAPVSLFYSYAHEDEPLRDELQGHLKILERRGLIAPWHDRKLVAGQSWDGQIDAHLNAAELVLLLISKDFIASDYIMGTELAAAMRRHAAHACTVVPIMVRAVNVEPDDAEDMPFLKLQGLPTDLRPVTSWDNRDEAWTNVAKGLRATVKDIRDRRRPAPAAPPVKLGVPRTFGSGGGESRPPAAGAPAAARPPMVNSLINPAAPPSPAAPAPAGLDLAAAERRPAPTDPVLATVVTGVVSAVDRAQRLRTGGVVPDAGAHAKETRSLRDQTQALIDMPDQKRILWVDDRPEGNRFEAAALAKLQIEIVFERSTDDALAALETARTQGEPFDLVISDWTRPREPPDAALTLIRAMKDAGHAQPVVIYHAEFDVPRRAQRTADARRAGALGDAVLPTELMALVARGLRA